MSTRDPYSDTSVPVTRSQEAIRKLLVESGALAVRFDAGRWEALHAPEEAWRDPCVVEFVWQVTGGRQMVRVQTTPKQPASRGKPTSEQRVRQAWRGLYWYLKGALDAARFGVIRFEDVFLSFIVTEGEGSPTVGEVLVPRIQAGAKALIGHYSAHELKSGDVLEGEVVE